MAGLMESIIQGYSNAVLGPDTSGASQQTADAWQTLNDALNQKYANQKKMFESDPNNDGKQYQAPDPMTRFKDQVSAMISSGNPLLQKRGIELISAPTSNSNTPAIKEYQYALRQGYKGDLKDWKKLYQAGTTVNVNTGNDGQGVYLTKDQKVQGGLDPNAPYVWGSDGTPKPVGLSKQSEEQKPINVAEATLNDLESMLFGDQGIYNDYAEGTKGRFQEVTKANIEKFLQSDPRYAMYDQTVTASLSSLARSIGGEKGALAEGDVERVKSLLPVLTGINPDTPQVASQKVKRLRNLVALARKKGGLTSEEIKRYTTGFGGKVTPRVNTSELGVPESIARPDQWNTSASGVKYKVIE